MLTTHISRETSNLLKGAGILLIVLHNFFHNIPPLIGQNEFLFSTAVTDKFISAMQASPTAWTSALFSYLGHYGVQLFIFLSAYGLTRRYTGKDLSYAEFIKTRFGKIYLSFVICLIVYILLGLIKSALVPDEKILYWDSLTWKLLLVSNFVPDQAMMPVGPWWFIPFIMQFYLIYPVLLYGKRYIGTAFLAAVAVASILSEWLYNPYLVEQGLNLNYMVFGHFPVICLGIYMASRPSVNLHWSLVIAAFIVFLLGCTNAEIWLLGDLGATILLLGLFTWLFGILPDKGYLARTAGFYGAISFHLFMVNGFLRTPFHDTAVAVNEWWFTILSGISSLLFSTLFTVILMKIDKKTRSLIKGRR